MADITNMLMDAMIAALSGVTDNVYQAPFAEYMEKAEKSQSTAVIFIGDPKDDDFKAEINPELLSCGIVYQTHRPFFRRFTVEIRKNYSRTTRDSATTDFGVIMMNAENVFYTWSTAVGPDDYGEVASLFCGKGVYVDSKTKILGGDKEFQIVGRIRVQFRTQ